MKWLLLALSMVTLALLAACGGDDDTSSPATEEITVFAASSLTAAFTRIGDDFEAQNPGVSVVFNFGGSQDLRAQLEQGAAADIFASADTAQMDLASSSGLVAGETYEIARNKLVIIAPKANDARIGEPQDLASPGVKVILGGETVPVGRYTRRFLEAASASADFGADYGVNVLANVVSNASNVKEVVSAVQLGEVDAGIVYVTDVTGEIADDVTMIGIPDDVNQEAFYPMALTAGSIDDEVVQAFADYVVSAEGQPTFHSFGFE